ncbi:Octanoyl-[GcvH]:protein N-octanoyltransferase [Arthrobacter agilis]|uniref:lipoate--protein ligase family protein n=1 Tax=Arthrobacter agilis TaxID=37921 RepID=UPI000F71E2D9|nr:lipoate--protein ligase family protein [Arthrobacter agilis]VDR31924.1 Octanoyl-[GcvH]:protein N-octanoyltransferase [Arthrobacter agilis]
MSTPWNGADALAVVVGAGDADPGETGAAAELDRGITLLREAAAGTRGPVLRLYRPSPTVAFGQRDARLPGFPDAADAAAAHGYAPLVRRAGGRAAAYHRGCLVVDHIEPAPDGVAGTRARFAAFGDFFAGVLGDVGLDAHVGEVPGEYCPGEFSVHGRRGGVPAVKLVGTAQRVVAGAWLFSSVVVVQDAGPLRAVLTDVYAALGLAWDPSTAGAAEDLAAGVTVDDVERALLASYVAVVRLAAGP